MSTQNVATTGLGYTTYTPWAYVSNEETFWKPKIIDSSISQVSTLTLGHMLFASLLLVAIVGLILVFTSMFIPRFPISTKFALFLTLLFGGLAVEVLYAKRLMKNKNERNK